MKPRTIVISTLLFCFVLTGLGCTRAARDTTGFALREEAVMNAPFQQTWHAVKRVLLEQGYEIYTRDKRGTFVAYTPMTRILWTQPRRIKFTIELAETAPNQTAVCVESIRQVYGVTLLTYPNWHDRRQTDPEPARNLLAGIAAKLAEGLTTEPFVESPVTPEDETVSAAPLDQPQVESVPLPSVTDLSVEDADSAE